MPKHRLNVAIPRLGLSDAIGLLDFLKKQVGAEFGETKANRRGLVPPYEQGLLPFWAQMECSIPIKSGLGGRFQLDQIGIGFLGISIGS